MHRRSHLRQIWPSRSGRRSPACAISLSAIGPAASSLFATGGFWFADEDARSPDIQFHLGFGSGIEAGIAKLANAGVTLNCAFLRPRSRGTVRLASGDPRSRAADRSELLGRPL